MKHVKAWTVTLPGQPVSGNHANKIGRGYARGGRTFPKMVKTEEAEAYQNGVMYLTKAAKPSWWRWDGGMVVTEYRFYLADDADCTNLIKVIEDAVFPALGINDSYALPRAMSKVIVPKDEARVEVTIR